MERAVADPFASWLQVSCVFPFNSLYTGEQLMQMCPSDSRKGRSLRLKYELIDLGEPLAF